MSGRKTTEGIILEFKNIHENKYDYSKVEYVNNRTKVCIICPEHGEFWQIPSSHLNGMGCWQCGVIKRSTAKRDSQDCFINKCIDIFKDKYSYEKVKYTNSKNYVIVTCKVHGDWQVKPNNILTGYGCPSCGSITSVANRINGILQKKFKDLIQPEDYKLIPLTQGKFAKVDNEDFDKVKGICWSIINNDYGESSKHGLMHRYILQPPKDLLVDHKNGNGLDNRKSNLRLATNCQNSWNSKKNSSNNYKGVNLRKDTNRWRATIKKNGVSYTIGCFDTEEEAGRAYDKKAVELFGEFARLNFLY